MVHLQPVSACQDVRDSVEPLPGKQSVTPLISIITICLNSRSTIERTIRSVLDQKHSGVEYIVIDGGSTDGTQDVVYSFGTAIDIFVSEPDKGISDGFNKGISLARGTIIGLINSDDRLLPGTIQKVLDFFQENPETQVVHGDLLLYSNNLLVKKVVPAGHWWEPWRLVLFNHPATFARKGVYDTFGPFSLDYRIAMDIDIFLRWLTAGVRIAYLPEPLVAMHYGGLSDARPYDGYREARRAFLTHGFPPLPVWFLYFSKCLLHRIGKIHAAVLAYLKNR
jgi:glycosyltransferase involved in cell wall biosynthesis